METLIRLLRTCQDPHERDEKIARVIGAVLVPEWERALVPGGRRTASPERARVLTVLQNALAAISDRYSHCALPWPSAELDTYERGLLGELVGRAMSVLDDGPSGRSSMAPLASCIVTLSPPRPAC